MFTFGGCQLFRECYADVAALDTFDSCPNRCGGNGECVPTTEGESFCRCTVPGFTGHDCMDPLTCEQDCGRHGQCLESGQCMCENGWTGGDCARELPCPSELGRKCGGRGICLESGFCHCREGWRGAVCDQRSGAALLVETRVRQAAASACPHGCCGRGVCDEASGECRCGVGWYGPSCTINATASRHPNATVGGKPGALVQGPPPAAALLARVARRRLLAEAGKKRVEARRKQRDAAILQEMLSKAKVRSNETAEVKASLQKLRAEAASLTKAAAAADRRAAAYEERERPARRKALALILTATTACGARAPDLPPSGFGGGKRRAEPKEASARGFGFEGEADHSQTIHCVDSCNFRGVCSNGTCYCQPGFSGVACHSVKVDSKTTVSLPLTLAVSGIVLLSTAIVTCLMTNSLNPDVRTAERELGYV